MKTAFIIISILIGISIALLIAFGKYSQKGQPTGLVDGSLSKCSDKPNCVCSEFKNDIEHYIEPVTNAQNNRLDGISKAVAIIKQMNGVISSQTESYISATFTSTIFGFVDDFEIRIDPVLGIMHFRSASRVGHSDGGVNRKRIESFIQLYRDQ